MSAAWGNWKKCGGVLCDGLWIPPGYEAKGDDTRNSGKASIGVWCRDAGNREKPRKKIGVNEMRMLRWMCEVTKQDKIRNEHVRRSVTVA